MNISRVILFISLFFLASFGLGQAQNLSLEAMGGSALNFITPLTIHQAGYPDLQFNANYDTKPLGPYTAYYSWRIGLWKNDQAWEIQQVHHRIFLTNPPPEVQVFAIHFGYNYFLFGHAWKREGLIFHLAVGPIITNPENTIRGQKLYTSGTGLFDQGYDFSGLGFQSSISKNIYINPNLYAVLEVAFIAGWAWWVPIADGYADVPNMALHGHIGMGYSF